MSDPEQINLIHEVIITDHNMVLLLPHSLNILGFMSGAVLLLSLQRYRKHCCHIHLSLVGPTHVLL